MINRENLHLIRGVIDISDDEFDRFHSTWPNDISNWEFIAHKYTCLNDHHLGVESQRKFCEAYHAIMDPSWPMITSVASFDHLPEYIKQECQSVHKFSPQIWFNKNLSQETWTSSGVDSYPLHDVIRAHYVLNRNHDMIQGQRVIDFPCSYGTLAFWMANYDFKQLALADVQPESLRLVDEFMTLLKVPNQRWSTVQADLYDLANNTALCENFDTLLLAGVLYHIHDHFAVLESITASNIPNIIIETQEHTAIKDSQEAMIWWKTESTGPWHNGQDRGQSSVLVGFPNTRWIDLAMKTFGYHRRRPADFYPQGKDLSSGMTIRSVHVFSRNK